MLATTGSSVADEPNRPASIDVGKARDPNGRPPYLDAIQSAAATGAGFNEYLWARPGTQKPVPKLAHTRRRGGGSCQ
jgi:methyl-accepting chemotaxis protein